MSEEEENLIIRLKSNQGEYLGKEMDVPLKISNEELETLVKELMMSDKKSAKKKRGEKFLEDDE